MTKMAKWTIADINELSVDDAIAHFSHLYEHSPWVVERAWTHRPFLNVEELHAVLRDRVRTATRQDQSNLIRSHPDLVGQAALSGSLTPSSTAEQRAAGLSAGSLSDEEKSRFAQLNEAYTTKFGFPFVICARENRKQAILAGFLERLTNDMDTEIAIALQEIDRIAWYRLTDLVGDDV